MKAKYSSKEEMRYNPGENIKKKNAKDARGEKDSPMEKKRKAGLQAKQALRDKQGK